MAQTNMNLIRKTKQLEAVKSDVRTRTDRAMDDDGDFSSELFVIKNPEISQPPHVWLKERTEECTKLQAEIDDLMAVERTMESFDNVVQEGRRNVKKGPEPNAKSGPSLAKEMFASDEWEALVKGNSKGMLFESKASLKTLFETTGASGTDQVSVESVRTGELVTLPRTRVSILDLITQIPTDQAQIKYDRETKNLSNVGVVAQGDVYTESEFQIEENTATVVKVGAYIQVSEELLEDEPEIRGRLNASLTSQMMRRIQDDIIGGSAITNAGEYVGTPVANTALIGFMDLTGSNVNAFDGMGVNAIDAVERAIELIYRVGEADADAIVMNSQDWLQVSTLQATTGTFIMRPEGAMAESPRQISGIPVILCNSLPVNTALVGAFRDHSVIRDRQSVQVRVQEAQHIPSVVVSSNMTAVTQTRPTGRFNIYTDARLAFYVRRGLGFCQITNFGQ